MIIIVHDDDDAMVNAHGYDDPERALQPFYDDVSSLNYTVQKSQSERITDLEEKINS